jgi:hypothetical protein
VKEKYRKSKKLRAWASLAHAQIKISNYLLIVILALSGLERLSMLPVGLCAKTEEEEDSSKKRSEAPRALPLNLDGEERIGGD